MPELITSGWMMHYLTRSALTLALMAVVAWLGDRWLRRLGPAAQHRLWLAALLMSVLLPLAPAAWLTGLAAGSGNVGGASATLAYRVAAASGRWSVSPELCAVFSAIYLLSALFALVRLMWRWQRSCAMRRRSVTMVLDGRAARLLEDAARRAGVAVPAVRCSMETCGPVVLGARRPALVLPEGFFDTPDEDVFAALAHECVHIARRDFVKNLFYEFAAVAVAYHPACWLMRRRIAETREMICDELAAATGGRAEYAASLLRLARAMAAPPPRANQAIGVFDGNTLEERIMRLTMDMPRVSRARKIVMSAIVVSALLGGAWTAMAVPLDVTPQTATHEKVYKVGGDVKPPVLTYSLHAAFPKKPKGKVDTTVVCSLVVNTEGLPQNITINKSGGTDFDQNAIEAVRQYRFKPATRQGQPVAVAILIEVRFRRY